MVTEIRPFGDAPCPRRRVGCALVGSDLFICGGTSPIEVTRGGKQKEILHDHNDVYILHLGEYTMYMYMHACTLYMYTHLYNVHVYTCTYMYMYMCTIVILCRGLSVHLHTCTCTCTHVCIEKVRSLLFEYTC